MKPIRNFTDHPQLKNEPTEYIGELKGAFIWTTPDFIKAIQIVSLTDNNLGDPFRQFARVKFRLEPAFTESSMDISIRDAVQLVRYCNRSGYEITISNDLKENRSYQSYSEED